MCSDNTCVYPTPNGIILPSALAYRLCLSTILQNKLVQTFVKRSSRTFGGVYKTFLLCSADVQQTVGTGMGVALGILAALLQDLGLALQLMSVQACVAAVVVVVVAAVVSMFLWHM